MDWFFLSPTGWFSGVWLGGLFYDELGSYDIVWWVGVGVGAFSRSSSSSEREPLLGFRGGSGMMNQIAEDFSIAEWLKQEC